MRNAKNLTRLTSAAAAASLALAVGSGSALAAGRDLGDMAADWSTMGTAFSTLITILIFVVGITLGGIGIYMFYKAKSDAQNRDASVSNGLWILLAGVLMVAIPTAMGSGILTIFGEGAVTTDADSGFTSLGS